MALLPVILCGFTQKIHAVASPCLDNAHGLVDHADALMGYHREVEHHVAGPSAHVRGVVCVVVSPQRRRRTTKQPCLSWCSVWSTELSNVLGAMGALMLHEAISDHPRIGNRLFGLWSSLDFPDLRPTLEVMATKTSVLLVDDLDGESEATETVRFGLGGTDYEIDLSEANAAQMRETLSKYVSAARKTGSTSRRRGAGRRITTDLIDPAAVRAWAAAKGIDVSSRGRIKADVVGEYRAAGN